VPGHPTLEASPPYTPTSTPYPYPTPVFYPPRRTKPSRRTPPATCPLDDARALPHRTSPLTLVDDKETNLSHPTPLLQNHHPSTTRFAAREPQQVAEPDNLTRSLEDRVPGYYGQLRLRLPS
jgi:hypothetical protein